MRESNRGNARHLQPPGALTGSCADPQDRSCHGLKQSATDCLAGAMRWSAAAARRTGRVSSKAGSRMRELRCSLQGPQRLLMAAGRPMRRRALRVAMSRVMDVI